MEQIVLMSSSTVYPGGAKPDEDGQSDTSTWYNQAHVGMGNAFLEELERTNSFLTSNPHLYPCVEQEIR